MAAAQGWETCLRLLGVGGADMNLPLSGGDPPLFYALQNACRSGGDGCVRACLDWGASPDMKGGANGGGITAPMRAIELDCLVGMSTLCDFGFDASVADDSGRTIADMVAAEPFRDSQTGKFLSPWLLARSEAADIAKAMPAPAGKKAKPRI